MKLRELLYNTGIDPAELPMAEQEIVSITCDSRKVEAGCLFVCIVGTAVDGHCFAEAAYAAGAVAVVVQRDMGLPNQLLVEDSRFVWAELCANWYGRPGDRLHLIGVTGTNGKTTITSLIKSMLEYDGHKVGLLGTIQNMIGEQVLPSGHTTPDAYHLQSMLALMVADGCDYCVMEVSSHALDQHRVGGCHYDVGVFTNLTQDHLDYHKTMENYLLAKKRLFSMCDNGVFNLDDPAAEKLMQDVPCVPCTYSATDNRADYVAHNIRHRADGVDFELVAVGQIGRVRLNIPGQFSVYNGLAAATACLLAGMEFRQVVAALSAAKGVKGRVEVVPTGRDFGVIIDYAHTPDGLENICQTLKESCSGRLITLFGCGGDRDKTKRPKMGAIAAANSDELIITSDNPRTEDPQKIIEDILVGLADSKTPYTVIPNRVEAIHWGIAHAQPGDILLLAGKGHETYQVVGKDVIHMDEREIIADALAE